MACGLPVVASDVGGNREVVCKPDLGEIVPFDDQAALTAALDRALRRGWNGQAILAYAEANSWDTRVDALTGLFEKTLTR
jgi:teichuronic acid biosynthesis glycosyltransferase TuaC